MSKKIEIKQGDVYGRLTILKEVEPHIQPSGQKQRMVLVQCSCGTSEPFEVALTSLRRGNTTSCGCLQKEKTKEKNKKFNTYDLETYEYGIGYTSKNEPFYFDKEDFDKIKDYCWCVDAYGYVVANTKKTIRFHRLIMDCPEDRVVDHINRVKHDNRKSNLRICTQAENSKNLSISKNNTSGITGVSWYKKNSKWIAQIRINRKLVHLGYFENLEDAAKARKEAEEKYFGEFACKDKELEAI